MDNNKKQEDFLSLFNPVYDNIWRFCLALSRDRERAEDLLSETLLIAFEKFDSIKNKEAFLSFMFTIASRLNSKNYKKNRLFEAFEPDRIDELYSREISPEDRTDLRFLHEALEKLPDKQRETVILFEIIGLSRKEIADVHNTTVANVKIRLFRARKKLKRLLTDNDIISSHSERSEESIIKQRDSGILTSSKPE